MCGRFVQHADPELYASRYRAELDPDGLADWHPSYNMAPTRPVLAIRAGKDGGRRLSALRWGLIPSWSKGPDNRYSMINARAETVASKPAYRNAFKRRRCVIPAEGFYEWQAPAGESRRAKGKAKQPYFIHRKDDWPILLAGLWEFWRPEEGDPVHSCTIIVTDANAAVADIHERMPVVLDPSSMETWLNPDNADTEALRSLLQPAPAEDWVLQPVSRRVNSPANDEADLLEPLDNPDVQPLNNSGG